MLENIPLAPFTTFQIGGEARWLVEAQTEDEIVEAVDWARRRGVALFVLGGGSNVLISDAGFAGLVLRICLRGVTLEKAPERAGSRTYRVTAGEDWDSFVERTVQDDCAGVECLAGIPGTVGGTPVQNVGAYGQEASSTIACVRVYDLHDLVFHELPPAECGFSYRHSRFNSTDRGRFIVTRVDYRLVPGGEPTLSYADLQRVFAAQRRSGAEPSVREVAGAVRDIRRTKGMLLVEGDPDCRSAGSFFKNPIVSEAQARQIAQVAGREPIQFPAGAGQVKVAAAWLIEQAGFARGYGHGRAGVSTRHTLALVNRGGARAADVLALAAEIQSRVETRFAVKLDLEPDLVGFPAEAGL